jgi:hypothetical protein
MLTEQQVKKCIFHLFPPKWQHQFIRSGKHVATMALSDIIEFMSNEKIFADAQDTTPTLEKKPPKKENGDSSSFKKRKHNEKKPPHKKERIGFKGAPQNDDECPIQGGHKWLKFFDNPNGDSYKPRGQDERHSDGGRGGLGCGGPGRGGRRGNGNGGGQGSHPGRGTGGQYAFETPAAAPAPATHHQNKIQF